MGHQTIFILLSYDARTVLLDTSVLVCHKWKSIVPSRDDVNKYIRISLTFIIEFYGSGHVQ